MERVLVYVHGLGDHAPGYSDSWWDALSPHLPGWSSNAVREVVWADLLSGHLATLHEQLVAVEIAEEMRARTAAIAGPHTSSIPGVSAIGELVSYLCRPEQRQGVLARFRSVLWPLLATEAEIHIVSHSWGTVVAFEGLRTLGLGSWPGRVRTWFTVGAALSISAVRSRLLPEGNLDLVDHWANLNARWDVVGGQLAPHFEVSQEYLDLDPVGCGLLPDPIGAHASYFRAENLAVNADIFAATISRTRSVRESFALGDSPSRGATARTGHHSSSPGPYVERR